MPGSVRPVRAGAERARSGALTTAGERRLWAVGGPQADHAELGDESLTCVFGAVVAPADQPAEDALDDGGDEAVSVLVLGENRSGLGCAELAMGWCESLTSDGDLDRLVGVEVAIPLCLVAESGDHEDLSGCAVLADGFEHGLVATPGPAAEMGEAKEATPRIHPACQS